MYYTCMSPCAKCGVPTTNDKYCSRSCANSANNKAHHRRKPTSKRKCPDCGIEFLIIHSQHRRCSSCNDKWHELHNVEATQQFIGSKTLGELEAPARAAAGNRMAFWRWREVRDHCRIVNRHRPKVCEFCGYDKHVEFCHKIALSKLPPETTVKDANEPSNVLILCRNCHWEFDHPKKTKDHN